jgi:phospholipid/cholesterol/gamma-HCH transport system substrate-binding protein
MTSKAQSIRVGLFAVATIVLLGVVLVIFGGLRLWERSDHYRIVFATSVYGLEPGAEVFLNGIKVGSVDSVGVVPEDIRQVAVAVKVKRRAMLQYAGITGLKVIDLRDGTTASPVLPSGSQIAAGSGLLDKLEAQAQTIVDQTTQLMQRANHLTDNLIAMSDNLGAITDPAKRTVENLAAMSGALKTMVEENRTGLRDSLAAVQRTADGASHLMDGATHLMDGQVATLFGNASELIGDFKKLLTSNEAPLRAAVFDLRQASRSFKELARDVRQRPSRLLFSSSPAERQLP